MLALYVSCQILFSYNHKLTSATVSISRVNVPSHFYLFLKICYKTSTQTVLSCHLYLCFLKQEMNMPFSSHSVHLNSNLVASYLRGSLSLIVHIPISLVVTYICIPIFVVPIFISIPYILYKCTGARLPDYLI